MSIALAPVRESGITNATADQVDRRLGWLISLGGVFLLIASIPDAREQWATLAPWWRMGAVVFAVLCGVMALLEPHLPMRALRALWTVAPCVFILMNATWGLARDPTAAVPTTPWSWDLEPLAVSMLVLVVPWQVAAAYSQLSAVLVLLSTWLVDGVVSHDVLALTPIHMGNIAFVAIFVAIRQQVGRLWASEQEAARQETRRVEAAAAAVEQRRVAVTVHDEILSTLSSAMRVEGRVPRALATQAARALTVIHDKTSGRRHPDARIELDDLLAAIEARTHDIAPDVRVSAWTGRGVVPAAVADAVVAACAEALRNSVRHADDGSAGVLVTRRVDVTADEDGVVVIVRDDGRGFDVLTVDAARVGVRASIIERLTDLPGGSAIVRSVPGAGTTVTLRWIRPTPRGQP